MNSSGKTLVIFLVIVAILLISLTAMSIFIFQKEIEKRKQTEIQLEKLQMVEMDLRTNLKELSKQKFILEEKQKEADERINSLLDELELETGLRAEMTNKYNETKSELTKVVKDKEKTEGDLKNELKALNEKVSALEGRLQTEIQTKEQLRDMVNKMEEQKKELTDKIKTQEESLKNLPQPTVTSPDILGLKDDIHLDKIVIAPKSMSEGRIISVDRETDFVIVNLGEKDGLQVDMLLSVVRDETYLGDIKITRLHPEMSAADLVPPFSIQVVRKNDKVIVK